MTSQPTEQSLESMNINDLCREYKKAGNSADREKIFNAMYECGRTMGITRFRYLSTVHYEPDALDIALGETMQAMKERLDTGLTHSGVKKPIDPKGFDGFFMQSLHHALIQIHRQQRSLSRYRKGAPDESSDNHPVVFQPVPEYDEHTANEQELQEHFQNALCRWITTRIGHQNDHRMQDYCNAIETFLYTIKEVSFDEIAERMGSNAEVIRKRVSRGRETMRLVANSSRLKKSLISKKLCKKLLRLDRNRLQR